MMRIDKSLTWLCCVSVDKNTCLSHARERNVNTRRTMQSTKNSPNRSQPAGDKRIMIYLFSRLSSIYVCTSARTSLSILCDRLLLTSTISPNYNKVYSHRLTAFLVWSWPFESLQRCNTVFLVWKIRSSVKTHEEQFSSQFLFKWTRWWRTRKHLFSTTCITVHKKVMKDAK